MKVMVMMTKITKNNTGKTKTITKQYGKKNNHDNAITLPPSTTTSIATATSAKQHNSTRA